MISSLFSLSYNTIKTFIQGGNTALPLGPAMHMLAAAEAGALTLVFTNPLWVVKTRLCLQYDAADSKTVKYNGMLHGLTHIYKQEGIRGLYKVHFAISTQTFILRKRYWPAVLNVDFRVSFRACLVSHMVPYNSWRTKNWKISTMNIVNCRSILDW